jgi:hypothetical protein
MARDVKIDAGIEALPSPQWVKDSADRWQSTSLHEQLAIMVGNECSEQSHEVSDGETKG